MSAASALSELGLDARIIRALGRKARRNGRSTPEYVRGLIEAGILADETFDDILAPVRAGFRKSGLTVRELDAILVKARRSARPHSRRAGTRAAHGSR